MPGEITLAHRGVLFLDELPEFARAALEALRQPLEDGRVEITRGQRALDVPGERDRGRGLQPLPVRAATRPLRLHRAGAGALPAAPERPARRPDRPRLPGGGRARRGARRGRGERPRELRDVRARVAAARKRQLARLAGTGALCNGDMDGRLTRREVPLDAELAARLLAVRDRVPLSGRGHDRVLRVARTIADLDGRDRAESRATSTRRSPTGSTPGSRSRRDRRLRRVSPARASCSRTSRRGSPDCSARATGGPRPARASRG